MLFHGLDRPGGCWLPSTDSLSGFVSAGNGKIHPISSAYQGCLYYRNAPLAACTLEWDAFRQGAYPNVIARTPAGCRTLFHITRRRPDRLNGPFGTTALNDLGARVINIEQPGHGYDTRTYGPFYKGQSLYFSFVNCSKESIVLKLKEEADRGVLLNMIRHADVLTEISGRA